MVESNIGEAFRGGTPFLQSAGLHDLVPGTILLELAKLRVLALIQIRSPLVSFAVLCTCFNLLTWLVERMGAMRKGLTATMDNKAAKFTAQTPACLKVWSLRASF